MAKTKIAEGKLLKAIAELEAVTKGDPLEEADPEGGLSTEGEPLSDGAPRGRGDATKKSRRASASSPFGSRSSSSASSDASSDDGDDADAMSPQKPIPKKGKKVSKAAPPPAESSESDSDDDSSAGSSDSDDSDDADKSFRDAAEGDEVMSKGLVVNEFLEAMVDQISLALFNVQKSMAKSLKAMEQRLQSHIDDRVAKSAAGQGDFNARLAKAVAAIGNTVQGELLGMADMVKSMANQPVSGPRGKAVLSKGEVNAPPWSGPSAVNADQRMASGSGGDYVAELSELSPEAIGDWLFKKSASQAVDPRVIMAWEADRYNVEVLPVQIRKAIANDLIK